MQGTDLELIQSAVSEASDIAMTYWSGDNEVWEKGPDDPVSQADLAVDTYLRETLLAARPEYGWLSEETADTPDRLSRQFVFVVDPIDGTRSFVAGQSTWAISVGLVQDGVPVAGIVALPARQKTYAAETGRGATLNGKPIRANATAALVEAHVLANKATLDPSNWAQVPDFAERAFRPSLAYRLCLVAEGRFDAMITFRDCWEWDVTAGALIAQEAGGIVTDRVGAVVGHNDPTAKTHGMIAAAPGIHAALIRAHTGTP